MEVDVLLARVHIRLARLVTAVLTQSTRKILEGFTLLFSLGLLASLVFLHLQFISQPSCLVREISKSAELPILKSASDSFNTSEIPWHVLRIKISGFWERQFSDIRQQLNHKQQQQQQQDSQSEGDGTDELTHRLVTKLSEESTTPLFDFLASHFPVLKELGTENDDTLALFSVTEQERAFRRQRAQDFIEEIYSTLVGDLSYQFSFERGYLFLRDELKARHGIIVHNITIHSNNTCFGESEVSSMLENFVGYDTIIANSLIHAFRGHGYFHNLQTQEIYNLHLVTELTEMNKYIDNYLALKLGVIVTSALLYLVSVTVVSFALRETQIRVLNFSLLLHRMSRLHLSLGKLILYHVLQCIVFVVIMIGILYCIAEILDDTFLALLVLSHIWMGELYTMICTRTRTSMMFFPKFFYVYFLLFNVYFFSYPFGFYYLAFLCMVSFVQHAMLYFYNRFELPALENGTARFEPHFGPSIVLQSFVTTTTTTTTTTINANNNNPPPAPAPVPAPSSPNPQQPAPLNPDAPDRSDVANSGVGEEEDPHQDTAEVDSDNGDRNADSGGEFESGEELVGVEFQFEAGEGDEVEVQFEYGFEEEQTGGGDGNDNGEGEGNHNDNEVNT